MAKITKEMIARILAHVGGAANVAQAGNCMTRLRLTLRDEGLADTTAIRQIDGVMGVIAWRRAVPGSARPRQSANRRRDDERLTEEAPAARRRPMSRRRENRAIEANKSI